MTEEEWLFSTDLTLMIDFVPVTAFRRIRLFSCACCRRIWHLLLDNRSRGAVEVSELFADGLASVEQLSAAAIQAGEVGMWEAVTAATKCASEDRFGVIYAPGWVTAAVAKGTKKGPGFRQRRAEVLLSEAGALCQLLRDIFGNPFRSVTLSPEWRTETAAALARQMYSARDFSAMPFLANALQDAGCDNADILDHCRGPGSHVRGCWVVDAVLNKE
jgi:hypothetical protein